MQPSGNDDPPQTPEFNRQLFTSLVQGTRQSNALPGEHEHAAYSASMAGLGDRLTTMMTFRLITRSDTVDDGTVTGRRGRRRGNARAGAAGPTGKSRRRYRPTVKPPSRSCSVKSGCIGG